MSNFPTSLDNSTSLPNPTGTSTQNSPDHAGLHVSENTSIIATQTKVGIGASTPTAGTVLSGTGTGTSAWSSSLSGLTLVAPTITGGGSWSGSPTISSPTISSPVITNGTISADAITGFTTSNTGTIYGIPIAAGVINTAGSINGASLVAASVGTTALATNAVQGNQLATNAITLGYAQITTAFTTTSTTFVQVTGLTATVTIPAGGRRVRITAFAQYQTATVTGNNQLSIWDGTVASGTQLAGTFIAVAANNPMSAICIAVVSPSAGSKTYNVGFATGAGTGTFGSSASTPAFILVEAI